MEIAAKTSSGLGTNRSSEISDRLAKLREFEPPWEDLLDMMWLSGDLMRFHLTFHSRDQIVI